MARIPDDEIARLKHDVSLERLVRAAGVELERHGSDLIGLCPMHPDKTPSLVVTPSKNLWHCLGACQQGGSVIDWVMKAQGVSFRRAVEQLRAELGLASGNGNGRVRVEASTGDREVLAEVVAYYHETLKQSPEALAYLESRGLTSSEMIERFQLGFANRTLGYRLSSPKQRSRLQALGLIRDTGHEHFNGSIVIPIFGEHGDVLGMYGRKITPAHKLRKGTPLHLYLPGPHRGLLNLEAVKVSKTVILCEALIDALTFWCGGFRNVTASYGVEGFTPDHLAVFKRHGTQTVLIAYDRDEAGERAALALAKKLMSEGIACYQVQFPRGMDVNGYATKVKPAQKSLGVLVSHAVWLGKGKPPLKALDMDLVCPEPPSAPTSPVPPESEPSTADGSGETPVPHDTAPEGIEDHASSLSLAAIAAKEEIQRASPPREVKADEAVFTQGDRRYRVRGLAKNVSHEALKVNLLVAKGDIVHVDTLDLYSHRQRTGFIKAAASELGSHEDTIKRDLGQVLRQLEEHQDERVRNALESKPKQVTLSEEERTAAMGLLLDPHLVERILSDFEACGVVGEETNKLMGYFAMVSRLLERQPIAILVQSSSAAGKSALMEAHLAFVPEEAVVHFSAVTGQALFYMGECDLKHKVLAITEERGAEKATYALKLLQSEGKLTIASTGKDPHTGRLVTQEYRVEGPVMIFLTTTAIDIDEELLNRCVVLTVDEDREQTRKIHQRQREKETLDGQLRHRTQSGILKVHQDAQRLLKPILVANPYAPQLTFLDDRTRTRRDHVKYLTLIRTIALLRQYQRPVKTATRDGASVPYIEVTLDDIALANHLAHQVLGRSLDELPPQTRRLLMELDTMVSQACQEQGVERKDYRLGRRQVREHLGWGNTQLKVHMRRLEDLEYLIAHRARRGQSFEYELVYDGQGKDGSCFLTGLIDVEALGGYDAKWSGQKAGWSAPGRPLVGPRSGGGRGEGSSLSARTGAAGSGFDPSRPENARLGEQIETPSCRTSSRRETPAVDSVR